MVQLLKVVLEGMHEKTMNPFMIMMHQEVRQVILMKNMVILMAEDPQDVVTDYEERNLRQSEAPYELVIEHGESEQMSSFEHNETTNNTTEDMSGSWQEDSANHWYPDSSENDTEE
ncbi:hypothetical protein KY290_031121 [Solanum tuberosum]|uniref:Integrase core domain containing protein n=1 Tax=Solanum tuberosum TaxID=4113 RepID=A0ABQ7U8J6_SOLTU|nr:hypothetical protein KY290_031121 [Solanum tuberosum]